MRKYCIMGFNLLLLLLLLTACGENADRAGTQNQDGPKEVVMATVNFHYTKGSWEARELEEAINDFNQSQSEYQVRIEYLIDEVDEVDSRNPQNDRFEAATEKLRMDLATGLGDYDILLLDETAFSRMDIQSLTNAGVFENLGAWLDKEGGLEREDFFNIVMTAYDLDGTLFTLPSQISVGCLRGRQSLLGDRNEWTLREFLDFFNEYPDMRLMNLDITEYVLMDLHSNGTFSFVDIDENGEFYFDDQLCADYLKFLMGIPERQGEDVLSRSGISFETAQMNQIYYSEPQTYIGYPTQDKKGGFIVSTDKSLSIYSKSDCKKGAWAFLEYYLLYQRKDDGTTLIDGDTIHCPSLKDKFDERVENLIYSQWIRDENGEIVLDENGNPQRSFWREINGEISPPITEEDAEFLRAYLSRDGHIELYSTELQYDIFREESKAYFNGQKTLDEVVEIIGRRLLLYYQEHET